MEEIQVAEKQDMLDRKAAWIERMFERLFSAIQKDVKGTLLVLSVGLNFYIVNLYVNLQQTTKQEMIAEVRRSVRAEIPKQMAPIQAQQDSIIKNVDTSLLNLNGTVESVKQYIIKKTK